MKKFNKTSLLALVLTLGTLFPLSTNVFAEESHSHWGYGGAANPTQWGQIKKEFALCESGRDQSPIDLKNAVESTPAKIDFDYKSSPLVVVNNGHTIQVNYAPGSSVTINGEKYSLVQFHFHTPSEHEVNSKALAMELHLVHRNEAGKLAVVGVMLTKGAANPLIDTIWKNIPSAGKTDTVSSNINATDLLPKGKSYYSYDGSLTTPPCSEGVKWNVFVEPMTVSEEQIEAFEKLYQVDARPIQPSNGRVIQLHR
ncbi:MULTISPECIES: carbonic anhydrase [Pseudanabaena]|uniref:carbonic anhydrase n=2 Tax=Pseudanabaena TaxID=1152 RepID=L8MUM8_9CYAN|nr:MULTISPECIES: carbonic anhydrase family protein [Pseudanabaena]ELS31667.1 Carbonate dehydratase [Pseudanabaena biceps PCC 7429]MDG3496078.1 carbonic anhydrase family protein [Pseudanabaena catenata USMAC16]